MKRPFKILSTSFLLLISIVNQLTAQDLQNDILQFEQDYFFSPVIFDYEEVNSNYSKSANSSNEARFIDGGPNFFEIFGSKTCPYTWQNCEAYYKLQKEYGRERLLIAQFHQQNELGVNTDSLIGDIFDTHIKQHNNKVPSTVSYTSHYSYGGFQHDAEELKNWIPYLREYIPELVKPELLSVEKSGDTLFINMFADASYSNPQQTGMGYFILENSICSDVFDYSGNFIKKFTFNNVVLMAQGGYTFANGFKNINGNYYKQDTIIIDTTKNNIDNIHVQCMLGTSGSQVYRHYAVSRPSYDFQIQKRFNDITFKESSSLEIKIINKGTKSDKYLIEFKKEADANFSIGTESLLTDLIAPSDTFIMDLTLTANNDENFFSLLNFSVSSQNDTLQNYSHTFRVAQNRIEQINSQWPYNNIGFTNNPIYSANGKTYINEHFSIDIIDSETNNNPIRTDELYGHSSLSRQGRKICLGDINNDNLLDGVLSRQEKVDGFKYYNHTIDFNTENRQVFLKSNVYPYKEIENSIFDLDGDGKKEIIAFTDRVDTSPFAPPGNDSVYVSVYASNGTELDGWPYKIAKEEYFATGDIAVGEFRDENMVILPPNLLEESIEIIGLNAAGEESFYKSIEANNEILGMNTSMKLVDINNDSTNELLFSSTNGQVFILENDGGILDGFPISVDYSINEVIPSDINNDGELEIIVLSISLSHGDNLGSIDIFDLNGQKVTSTFQVTRDFLLQYSKYVTSNVLEYSDDTRILGKYLICADVNGDNNNDILFCLGNLIFATNNKFEIIDGFPIVIPDTKFLLSGPPNFSDLNQDGVTDLTVAGDDQIYCFALNSNYENLKNHWPSYRHDYQQTNNFGFTPSKLTPTSAQNIYIVNDELNFKIYPNPTKGIIKIESGFDNSSLNLKIYDLYGKLVGEKTLSTGTEHTYSVNHLKAGIYLIKINNKHNYKLIKN